MSERTSENEHAAEYHTAEFTSVESPTESFDAPAPGWGAPAWGAPQHQAPQHEATYDAAAPAAVVGHPGESASTGAESLAPETDDDEPFVPAKRYRMGRFTKVLVCVCLVLAGALGGAAIQKAVDGRTGTGTTGRNFSQFAPGAGTGASPGTGQNGAGQNGTGQGTGGYGGRSRASQGATAPTAPAPAPSAGSAGN